MRPLLALIVLCLAAWTAAAQEGPPLTPGARIRVTLLSPGPRTQIGNLQALSDTTLHLLTGSLSVPIPRANIDHLEVSRGRKLSIPGALAGLVLGAAAGGAVGCLANQDDYGVFCGGQSDTKVTLGVFFGSAAGAALGGLLFRRERWTRLDLAFPRAP